MKIIKLIGKHRNIGTWYEISFLPSIKLIRCQGYTHTSEDLNKYGLDFLLYVVTIEFLIWRIDFEIKRKLNN